ncbi:hypothetical protein JXB11_00130 [Candidatus Woesearchaeota archaeon]|nr:hypothetical protein [Candidatus Woesearchaeota archaeon]
MNWEELQGHVKKLCAKFDFTPDIIAAIARGGVIPGVMIAEKLGIKDMYAITVKKQEGKRKVMTKLADEISGKKVLLVEDAIESGKSMLTAKKYLEGKGAIVKTATLFVKGKSVIRPDYSLELVPDIDFPWEEVQK